MDQKNNLEQKYRLGNISFYKIRNRTERRVLKMLPEVLEEYPDYKPNALDLQDIYALALNSLPPHYVQEFTIVFKEKTEHDQIKTAIREALEKVRQRPTGEQDLDNI